MRDRFDPMAGVLDDHDGNVQWPTRNPLKRILRRLSAWVQREVTWYRNLGRDAETEDTWDAWDWHNREIR